MDAVQTSYAEEDPAFEFHAPKWYDFERLNDNAPSPSSHGDAYFQTSKVKGEVTLEATGFGLERAT